MTHTIAARLGALRRKVSLTQAQVAERAGLRRTEVARMETGGLKCSLAVTRHKLARAFGVSLDAMHAYLEGNLPLADLVAQRDASEVSS